MSSELEWRRVPSITWTMRHSYELYLDGSKVGGVKLDHVFNYSPKRTYSTYLWGFGGEYPLGDFTSLPIAKRRVEQALAKAAESQ